MLLLAKNTTVILQKLRLLMLSLDIANYPLGSYIVPSGDAHYSLRMADCDRRREFLTGFDGSAGIAVVTHDNALLWTDTRYFLQAEEQMDENWTVMKEGIDVPLEQWLVDNLSSGSYVGIDPKYYGTLEWDYLSKYLESHGKILTSVNNTNLVDLVWSTDRPPCPKDPITELALQFSGKAMAEKITQVYTEMENNKAEILVVTELDEIAWLLNLRGSDLPLAPVFNAYLILIRSEKTLDVFIDPVKISVEIKQNLQAGFEGTVNFYAYEDIEDRVKHYASNLNGKIWISKYCNAYLGQIIPVENVLIKVTPIKLLKALKNEIEVVGMKKAHIKDSVAIVRFLTWLENEMEQENANLTEISADAKLTSFKSIQDNYVGKSFPTISASGPHASIIHYFPNAQTDRPLANEEMYLIDSGSHYLDGTTDITRTIHFGTPANYQLETFTRVLKGHVTMAMLTFPAGTIGHRLDSFARASLWNVGLDFGHNPGHGIGAFLNLAEGPQNIGSRFNPDDPGLMPNMFLSNEPGYYKDREFGIRLENIVRVIPSIQYENFLQFDTISFVPFETKLINTTLLSTQEINWINQYHFRCRQILADYLGNDAEALEWLIRNTQELTI